MSEDKQQNLLTPIAIVVAGAIIGGAIFLIGGGKTGTPMLTAAGKAFEACVTAGKYQGLITQQFNDAIADGAQGTPFSVLITKDGKQVPIPGSQPLASVEQAIDAALKGDKAPSAASAATTTKDIPPVTAADHITGSIDAPVIIVEYTDLECPFCKQFDGTMQQVMAAYPGKVAWVMRNFPLQQLHPNAPKLALAAECVAELGGNDAYWKFLASIVTQAPINTFFDMTKLTSTAQGVLR